MKLILLEEVENLGKQGEVVSVKDGYGRNFLIPQKKAIVATKGAVKNAEEHKRRLALKEQESVEKAKEVAQAIEETTLTIAVKTGEEGRLHGTVTTQQVAASLAEKGIIVDRKIITLNEDIQTLGEYSATVSFSAGIKAQLKIWVVKAE